MTKVCQLVNQLQNKGPPLAMHCQVQVCVSADHLTFKLTICMPPLSFAVTLTRTCYFDIPERTGVGWGGG